MVSVVSSELEKVLVEQYHWKGLNMLMNSYNDIASAIILLKYVKKV